MTEGSEKKLISQAEKWIWNPEASSSGFCHAIFQKKLSNMLLVGLVIKLRALCRPQVFYYSWRPRAPSGNKKQLHSTEQILENKTGKSFPKALFSYSCQHPDAIY